MCFSNQNDNSCLWLILILILLFCCCGNNNSCPSHHCTVNDGCSCC